MRPTSSSRSRRSVPTWSVACVVALVLTGCGGADGGTTTPAPTPAAAPTVVSADDVAEELLQPLVGLGPCDVSPTPAETPAVEGLVLPPEAVVTSSSVDGPLTTVRGYVPATPVQTQVEYLRQEELEVLQAEHEVHESETLLAGEEHRLFVKVQAVCEDGSVFLAILAPEASGAPVPVPSGGTP